MSTRFDAAAWPPGSTGTLFGVPGLGVRGDAIPSTGTHGPGLLYQYVQPGDEAKEFSLVLTSVPTVNVTSLFVWEDSGFKFVVTQDGIYTIGYDWYIDGVSQGADTAQIIIGAQPGTGTYQMII